MAVSTQDIKLLRESTGAGVLDCKKALQETDGDIDEAIEFLRKKGLAAASKKASREAHEGLIDAKITDDGNVAVMVHVSCETDFVARTDDFQNFVETLVKQVQQNPDQDSVEALLDAPFIEDESKTVQQALTETIASLGENMLIPGVARFDLEGEGVLDSYIHMGGRVGVLVKMTDAPASDGLQELAHDIALQIAAVAPAYIDVEDIPASAVEAEKGVLLAQLEGENKPDNIKERIVEGRLKKWYSEVTLMHQEFVKDTDLTIEKLVAQYNKENGTSAKVSKFARFELGAN